MNIETFKQTNIGPCTPIDNPPVYPEAIMADHPAARSLLADWPGNGFLLDVLRHPTHDPQSTTKATPSDCVLCPVGRFH